MTLDGDPQGIGACWTGILTGDRPVDYEVLGLPPGSYKVGVFPAVSWEDPPAQPPEETVWYPAGSQWEDARAFAIGGADEVTGIDFDLR